MKLRIRSALAKRNLALTRDPYVSRVVRTLETHHIGGVLDVGANEGQFGSQLRSAGFRGNIHSFEPQQGAHDRLVRRTKGDPLWTSSQIGLGHEKATADLSIAGNSFSSSMLAMLPEHVDAAPRSKPVGVESITVSTLVDEMGALGWDPGTTMLKIDTQGFEAAVLRGAGSLVGKIPLIQVEVSYRALYEGAPLAAELLDGLTAQGYVMYTMEPGISSPTSGRLLQADILLCLQQLAEG